MSELETLQSWIDQSHNIVFFGGAGVSTESGIKDFRSPDGLYNQHYKFPPETMLSRSFFDAHPEEFFRFYRDKMLNPGAKPNAAHKKLAELEAAGKLRSVITQNIDGLHQMAGSQNVLELHGSENRYTCLSCGKKYDMSCVTQSTGVPKCSCGGTIRPDVVLYGEALNEKDLRQAIRYAEEADLMLVAGTSLVVYPVAGLVEYLAPGARLVILNRDPTPYDSRADLVLRGDLVEELEAIGGN